MTSANEEKIIDALIKLSEGTATIIANHSNDSSSWDVRIERLIKAIESIKINIEAAKQSQVQPIIIPQKQVVPSQVSIRIPSNCNADVVNINIR